MAQKKKVCKFGYRTELTMLGTLEGPEQWEALKAVQAQAKHSEHRAENVARYLYCKINAQLV